METGNVYRRRDGTHYVVVNDYERPRPLMLDDNYQMSFNTSHDTCSKEDWHSNGFYEGDQLVYKTLAEYIAFKSDSTSYEKIIESIQNAPMTYMPSILDETIEECVKKKVFKDGASLINFCEKRLGDKLCKLED